uniref:Uncharacterized protein n=1 Tax=viral metagenome TaxID=1070528 RepID=A0A6C0I585_9ZZZZ
MLSPKLTPLILNDNTKLNDILISNENTNENIYFNEEDFLDNNELINICFKLYTSDNPDYRIYILNNLHKYNKELCFEHFDKLLVQYLYNPLIDINKQTLVKIITDSTLPFISKYQCVKLIHKENKEYIENKEQSVIEQNNEDQSDISYDLILQLLSDKENIENMHSLIRVELMQMLIESYKNKSEVKMILLDFIIDENLCHYDIYTFVLQMSENKKTKSEYIIFMFKTICLSEVLRTRYLILASQFFLGNELFSLEDKLELENIIIRICQDHNLDFYLRADAADLLLTQGISERARQIGTDTIILMGRNTNMNITVYTDGQNIHTESIDASVKRNITLIMNVKNNDQQSKSYDDIYKEIITEYCTIYKLELNDKVFDLTDKEINTINNVTEDDYIINTNLIDTKTSQLNAIKSSLTRFKLDRSNRSVYSDIPKIQTLFIKVWNIILKHEHRETLKQRLFEELIEMNGTCSTGHISRLINVLSGFEIDGSMIEIKMDIKTEMSAVMMAKINKKIQEIEDEEYQSNIMEELMWSNNYEGRVNLNRFLRENVMKFRDELYIEYVTDQKMIDNETFEIYFRTILEKLEY